MHICIFLTLNLGLTSNFLEYYRYVTGVLRGLNIWQRQMGKMLWGEGGDGGKVGRSCTLLWHFLKLLPKTFSRPRWIAHSCHSPTCHLPPPPPFHIFPTPPHPSTHLSHFSHGPPFTFFTRLSPLQPLISFKWRLKVALIELRNNVATFQGHFFF